MSNQYNPWDTVNNPPEQVSAIFGEAHINAWACMLVTGAGKLPYDERSLTPEGETPRRYTAVDVSIAPLSESKAQYETKRSMLAEFGEWKDITWPSLKALGVLNAQELDGKFVRGELVPTGRKYQNQAGEEREAKAIKITHIFADRQACAQAYLAEFKSNGGGHHSQPAAAAQAPAQPANGNGKERETALVFAKAFVGNAMRQAGGDLTKARDILAPMLAAQPVISKHFTVDSPEIMELMAEAVA